MSPLIALVNHLILIYAGAGASEECVDQTLHTLRSLAPPSYDVEMILPHELIRGGWEEKTALLVIPGGADIPYTADLNGEGNARIRAYVEKGGSFLGICAGAYYAGASVEFAPGTALEVCGSRELAFFPGTVAGPILAPYDYETSSGVRVAPIGTGGTAYYNGGGYFVDAEQKPGVEVLAYYELEGAYPAIIECSVGKGKALLSGIHIEYDPYLLDSTDPYLQKILPALSEGNAGRLVFMKALLKRLLPIYP